MKRRKFFQSCAAFVAGVALGLHLKTQFPKWKINPEWIDAKYELCWCFSEKNLYPVLYRKGTEPFLFPHFPSGSKLIKEEVIPHRFDGNGNWIPPIIM